MSQNKWFSVKGRRGKARTRGEFSAHTAHCAPSHRPSHVTNVRAGNTHQSFVSWLPHVFSLNFYSSLSRVPRVPKQSPSTIPCHYIIGRILCTRRNNSWIESLVSNLDGCHLFSIFAVFSHPHLGALLKFVCFTSDFTLWNINYQPVALIVGCSFVLAFLLPLQFFVSFYCLCLCLFLFYLILVSFSFSLFSLHRFLFLLQEAVCSCTLLKMPQFIDVFLFLISWYFSSLLFFFFCLFILRGNSRLHVCRLLEFEDYYSAYYLNVWVLMKSPSGFLLLTLSVMCISAKLSS